MITYVRLHDLPDAIRSWSGKPLTAFPHAHAPVGYIEGDAEEENRALAQIFAALCTKPTLTDRQAFLANAVITHQRLFDILVDSIRGVRDPRMALKSDRSALKVKPYEAMINVMRDWAGELHEAALAEVGAELIQQSTRRAS